VAKGRTRTCTWAIPINPNPGTNACGKAMIALMSDRQISAFGGGAILEVQRRFPVLSPLHGDTRVMIGFMPALQALRR
jgi:hypothetical protein